MQNVSTDANAVSVRINDHDLVKFTDEQFALFKLSNARCAKDNKYYQCSNCGVVFYDDSISGLCVSFTERGKFKSHELYVSIKKINCNEFIMKTALE